MNLKFLFVGFLLLFYANKSFCQIADSLLKAKNNIQSTNSANIPRAKGIADILLDSLNKVNQGTSSSLPIKQLSIADQLLLSKNKESAITEQPIENNPSKISTNSPH